MGYSTHVGALAQHPRRRLIDEKGEFWTASDQMVRRQLGTTLSGAALVEFVVLNFGWVEFSVLQDRLSIRCRPRVASQRALASLFYSLHDSNPARISLSVFGTDWQHSIHRRIREVATIIGGMANVASLGSVSTRRALMNREIEPWRSPLYGSVLKATKGLSGASSLDAIEPELNAAFNGRWCICHVEAPTVIMDRVGSGLTHFNPGWHQQAAGPTLNHYADEHYGSWIASQRLRIARTRATVFDEFDAVVNFPRLGETRLQYTRATFPISLADGASYIVSAARTDSAINLRN
jgi:hypothetical protein